MSKGASPVRRTNVKGSPMNCNENIEIIILCERLQKYLQRSER